MKDLVIWLIHTPSGVLSLVFGLVALSAKKGSESHRKYGRWFTVVMLVMLVSGIVAAVLKNSLGDVFLGSIVIYSVFTAWLTTYRKEESTGVLEYLALSWILLIACAAAFIFTQPNLLNIDNVNLYLFWVIIAICFAIGDVRNLIHQGLTHKHRIIRHVLRIGFSLLWAALAFTDKIVKISGYSVYEMPYIVVLPAMVILITTTYWIVVVSRFSNRVLQK